MDDKSGVPAAERGTTLGAILTGGRHPQKRRCAGDRLQEADGPFVVREAWAPHDSRRPTALSDEPRGMNAMSLGSMSRAADSVRRKCLVAGRAYAAGEPVLVLDHVTWRAEWRSGAVRHPSGGYFSDPLLDGVIQRDNPNCRLSFELMALIARRDIRAGEVISNDFGGDLNRPRQ